MDSTTPGLLGEPGGFAEQHAHLLLLFDILECSVDQPLLGSLYVISFKRMSGKGNAQMQVDIPAPERSLKSGLT